jgi:hypothetical protein
MILFEELKSYDCELPRQRCKNVQLRNEKPSAF